jgi:hypothetical protein
MMDEEYGEAHLDDLESRLDDLGSRLDEVGHAKSFGDPGCGAALYSLGATMAAILSWHSFHAVLWALLAGLLSWLYVIYYVIVNWSNVKLI